jgi:hypothetical protein
MKKTLTTITGLTVMAGLLLTPIQSDARGNGQWHGTGQQPGLSTVIADLPSQDLSTEEELGMTKMREEEKLARDVYLAMYDKWNHIVFASIARSEQQHMDAIKILLDKYNQPDPVAGHDRGEFTDPELQALYDSLVVRGK